MKTIEQTRIDGIILSLLIDDTLVSGMATLNGEPVAFLDLDRTTLTCAQVDYVEVHPSHRRKGIATQMLRLAASVCGQISHSCTRTPDGQAWAKTTGCTIPDLQPVAAVPSSWT